MGLYMELYMGIVHWNLTLESYIRLYYTWDYIWGYMELDLLSKANLVQLLLHENVPRGESTAYPTPIMTLVQQRTFFLPQHREDGHLMAHCPMGVTPVLKVVTFPLELHY